MIDYKQMYLELFRSIGDAIRILEKAQQKTEDIYINSEPTNVVELKKTDNNPEP